MDNHDLEARQMAVCKKHGQSCMIPAPDTKLGFASETLGRVPMNGLRHPPQGDTNGWYVWCGDELSKAANFFSPHTAHLQENCPEILQFLGLPPGWRFLLAGDHADVWYDSSLLEV